MKHILSFIAFFILMYSASAAETETVDAGTGVFVLSWETEVTGPHGMKARKYEFAVPVSTEGLEEGWNYTKIDRKKHGLQLYLNKDKLSVEYYVDGKKRSTASYKNGEPDGWFYNYNDNKKKHGLQHYFSGDYQSVEEFVDGKKVAVYHYKDGQPDGWFYTYNENKKKDGVQTYVSGDYWSIETFDNGNKDGLSGAWTGTKKDGWHYTWAQGKKTGKTYYK